ncbi:hypothetical protein HDV02_004484 [Globomyces sp. JEL0801]|nr:hypothetical protein HDV02_004484 [Globomyces sp. JEL0801]
MPRTPQLLLGTLLENQKELQLAKYWTLLKLTLKTCLPITRTQFLAYLRCTEAFADDFMEA